MVERTPAKLKGKKPEWKDRMPDILKHEFVGLSVEVDWSSNPDAVGLVGHVVDETRNMLMIKVAPSEEEGEETEGGVKALPKKDCVFIFTLPDGERIRVEGKRLVSRPEDRIKKKQRKW